MLIGAKVEIVSSTNRHLVGLTGIVVDETKHTFIISTSKGEKRIIKKTVNVKS